MESQNYKKESQNLLSHKHEDDPRFETRKWFIVNITRMEIIVTAMMCNLLLNLIQKF